MKEYINYYYHLVVVELRLTDGRYFFHDAKHRYLLEPVYFSPELLENIYSFHEYLRSKSVFYHKMIKNAQGNIFSMIDQKAYVLLELSNVLEESISIYDLKIEWSIMIPRNHKYSSSHFPWFPLWEEKIDYFENSFFNREKKFFVDSAIFDFFVGMGENAISYTKETLKDFSSANELSLVPSHRRVSPCTNLIDFYNPLNIIIDLRVRDIAEYMKKSFWESQYDLAELEKFLRDAHFSKAEAQLFFSRLLFPSFYFDYLERKEFPKNLEGRLEEYQFFLTDIYSFLRQQYAIEEIRWLKKKT